MNGAAGDQHWTARPVISFVGAGPGAADLITLRGASRLAEADLVIWASSLVPREVLSHARPDVELHDSAGMTLEDVLALYEANPGRRIVRLHSGDPSVYGALQEQVDWCAARGRDFEIVPGVSSLTAAAAAAKIELTVPGVSQSVVLSRLATRTTASVPEKESIASFAAHGSTMGVFLSAAQPSRLQEQLLSPGSGYDEDTPVVIAVRVSWPEERVVRTRLGELAETLRSLRAKTTVLVLVGPALGGGTRRSHLYSPGFSHGHRRKSLPGTTTGRPAAAPRSERAARQRRSPGPSGAPTSRNGSNDDGSLRGLTAGPAIRLDDRDLRLGRG